MYDNIKQRRGAQKEVVTEKDDGCKEVEDEKCNLNEIGAEESSSFGDTDYCMKDAREDSGHNVDDHISDSKTEHRNILSYGISIDTSKIESVSLANQGSEL